MRAIAALCVAAAVPGTFVGASIGFSDHYREAIAEVGFLGLLLYWLYLNRNVRQLSLTLSWTRLWLTGLLLLATLSVFWVGDLGFFVSKYLLWLAAAAALWVTLTVKPDFDAMIDVARGFAIIAAYISIIGLVQALFSIDIFLQTHPPAATYHNKNAAMQVIVLVFPMIIFLLMFDRHKHLSIVYWFVLALALAFAFHTRTRSAWLALIMEAVIIAAGLLWQRGLLKNAIREGRVNWGRRHLFAALAAMLMLAAMLNFSTRGWGGFTDTVSTAATSLQRDITSYAAPVAKHRSERYRIWSSALAMLEKRPALGTGMGSFSHNLLVDSEDYVVFSPLRVHNDLLETGVELGAAGLLLLLASILGLLGGLWRLVRRGDFTARGFYLLIAAGLGGSAVNMQFSFPYQMPVPLLIFGVYAALIIKGGDSGDGNGNRRLKPLLLSLKRRHWFAGLSLTGIAFALALSINLVWFGILFAAENNPKRGVWTNPIHLSPPLCHRGIVRLFFHLSNAYREADRHDESRALADSINLCVPDTWLAQQIIGGYLVKQQRWAEAVPVLQRAKDHAPPGIYNDHISLLIAHLELGNLPDGLVVYEELAAEPVELLIKRKVTLQTLVLFAMQTDKMEEAKKFYRLHNQHYRKNAEFEAKILPAVRE